MSPIDGNTRFQTSTKRPKLTTKVIFETFLDCFSFDNERVLIVSSDRSSYRDDGLLYIRSSGSHFFRFSLHWSIGPLVHWSIGLLVECQMSNVICQMTNDKCQMSIRLNFCRSVPPEFLLSLVECQMSNVICQMSNVKNKMSIRLNFCRSVPPEFL